ncbi:phosphate ABC transporter substrate-binding protein [Duganella sp. FT92W]|uniref:Phosphate ABC transporter substrate-binding protein n=2 Tax=Pseudoduganella rivuli TaxID=2666085 RepID=A0A7X2LRW9_9BURK|nr:phosphate ABC transporter substrate-binding protein [Pseudoduganella rivuli]
MLSCIAAAAPSAHAVPSSDLVVIVSAKSPVTELRRDQVAGIFLAPGARFPHGGAAIALDQRIGSKQRDLFYSQVAELSPEQLKEHWSRNIFTGRGQPPREVAGNASVRRQVAQNPALIGYIDRSALDRSVRAVLVVN